MEGEGKKRRTETIGEMRGRGRGIVITTYVGEV